MRKFGNLEFGRTATLLDEKEMTVLTDPKPRVEEFPDGGAIVHVALYVDSVAVAPEHEESVDVKPFHRDEFKYLKPVAS
ncbi:hypothetical protein [Kineosporia succinea]|uniref:Uncharacterized protein n=1 Tax=Kineosporia succinea TaxID=84632 RepID=A0ABT9NXT9_9ACTN|nr:hypothetical protein [Kineosporia succinea]MDP9825231.1 hypothetical protein [Kineosporia succinea]